MKNMKIFGWAWFGFGALDVGIAIAKNDATYLGLAGLYFVLAVLILWEGGRDV